MNTTYADSFLTMLLAVTRMDVEYVRARGDTLYHRDETGAEVPVLDLLGGWGSLMLGHNHPEIVARAKEFLDAGSPTHAQFSVSTVADQVGKLLNDILHREFPQAEDYAVTFANSGAEAIEVALKHAELDRLLRVQKLFEDLEVNIGAAVTAVATGAARLPDSVPGGGEPPADAEGLAGALTALAGQNAALMARQPIFFALERSFHGKLVGSVQLTHNPLYRGAFQALGLAARFVPPGEPEAVERIVAEERATFFDVEVTDGQVVIVERDFPLFAGFLLEPVQGEGGIHMLTREYVAELRRICDDAGCPIIVDEIQSGMGRTGAFFAGSHIGLLGDYVTLGKSLGGGLAKVSVTLVRRSLYRPQFELLHSSTFAKDGFSTAIALKALHLLEADDGRAYRLAAERGERVMAMLRGLAARFPDVITDVRGKGLLIGLQFADQSAAPSAAIREKSLGGNLSFVLASYLLHVHRIRIGPTASDPNVLRIEPSILLGDKAIEQLERGIEQVCRILRDSDALHLVHPLTRPGSVKPRTDIRNFRVESRGSGAPAERKAAFIAYVTSPDLLRELDPSLVELGDEDLTAFVRRHEPIKEMTPLPAVRVDTALGDSVDLTVYPLMITPEQVAGAPPAMLRADVEGRIRAAKADGCAAVGLGFALGAATGHGSALRAAQVPLTSGGALTVASAVHALENAARARFGGLDGLTLGVAGVGRVGSACAELASELASKIILVGGDRSQDRLRIAIHRIYQEAWARIAEGGTLSGIPALLAKEPLIDTWVRDGRGADEPSGERIAAYLSERHGGDPYVMIGAEPGALRAAHMVLSAVSSPRPTLGYKHLRDGAVVCDLAVPGTLLPGLATVRGDLLFATAGVVTTANGAGMPDGARGPIGSGRMFTGAAQAVLLALAGPGLADGGGDITAQRVREIAGLAERHGFRHIG